MKKEEFEELADMTVSDSDYEIINKVYTFHPTVRGTSGKNEIAELYKSFGMTIFYDMLPRAEKNCELERRLRQVQEEEEWIKREICDLVHSSSPEREEASTEVQESHGFREMIELIDETLMKYLRDTNITSACKKRARYCMKERIDDIYRGFFPGKCLLRDERGLRYEQG